MRRKSRRGGVRSDIPSEVIGKIASYAQTPTDRVNINRFADAANRARIPIPKETLETHEMNIIRNEILNDIEMTNSIALENAEITRRDNELSAEIIALREKVKENGEKYASLVTRMFQHITSPAGLELLRNQIPFARDMLDKARSYLNYYTHEWFHDERHPNHLILKAVLDKAVLELRKILA